MKAAQISTASFASRHSLLFQDLFDAAPGARKVLSIGCSSGFEPLDLRLVFPDAHVSGCDVSNKALAEAREKCEPAGISIFESNAGNIRAHGPYDVITCLNVLARYPEIQGKPDISGIYAFSDFDESISLIVDSLGPGGVAAVFNSCYLVNQASAFDRLTAVPARRHPANGWIEKYDREGRVLTRTTGEISGAAYGLKEWRQTVLIAARKLSDERRRKDFAEHRLLYSHELLTEQAVDLTTTLWRKKA